MPIPFTHTTRALRADRGRLGPVTTLLGLAVLGGWGAWLLTAEIDVHVPPGAARVELDVPVHPVQVEIGGRLVESRLTLGAAVEAGAVLARLDDRETRAAHDEARALRDGLVARRETRAAERAARAAAHDPADAADAAAYAEARARLSAARTSADVARDEARRATQLGGVVPAAEIARLDGDAARARAAVAEAREQAKRVDAQRAQNAADRAAALAALDAELATLDSEIAQADARLARLDRALEATVIRASASGRLADVDPRGVGAVLAPGDVLGRITGEGALRVVARLPAARALGRVAVGQRARLRFDGFSWTRYGAPIARVVGVATEPSGGGLRVELAPLLPGEAGFEPHDVPLQHGLVGQVEVAVEAVAPIELVLAALGRAIEPGAASPTAPAGEGTR